MKKGFKIAFFLFLAIALILATIIAASALSFINSTSESIGIIGGADGPTAILVTNTILLESPVLYAFGFVFLLLVVSAIGWIISKKK